MPSNDKTFFAPQLFINHGVKDISFYKKTFGAVETMLFKNDDGSIHVTEFKIDDALFHVHEVTASPHFFSPDKHKGNTTLIGLFVPDVDQVMSRAVTAGAVEISPAKDFEYGYRQGEIKDPFGHHWLIQQRLS